ncbi:uncharacterized protein K452DRAFT_318611 [Aplosporella prunicola CBS 121167]|uniref:L-cystine transporter-like protein n=1 Tax=Aplosporella prunicola CBS 121167 TaxID=1176127 RepID=A0A6A6BBR3_9PEZI|nr:uncharacterized protein K452DRAFT_318611 [Aplosporella prunicola CBS 121167]KAF2141639.1 hypothetical protein K452DRAFT_318611 [Aplosporella prunicola CBS 121167]
MAEPELVLFARAVSRVFGWIYFFSWSLSFYPQPLLNWRRRSTYGFSVDFPTLNVLGFTAYTIQTSALLYSPTIRSQYAYRYPAAPEPTVRFNDFFFAAHAFVISLVIYSQFWHKVWGFRDTKQRISSVSLGVFWGCVLGLVIVMLMAGFGGNGGYDPSTWAWIDVIYATGYVKLLVTVVKYIPQAWINYKRKSTVGWSIVPIFFDLTGGVLSLLQLVIDSLLQGDWSGVTGNPAKFGLGNVSIFFDIIFMVQHFVLYRHAKDVKEADEEGDYSYIEG